MPKPGKMRPSLEPLLFVAVMTACAAVGIYASHHAEQ